MLRRLAALLLGLVFTSAFLLHGGAGKSLEDGLSEYKRREVVKDGRFDQADSLYKRIRRFKRGNGKPNQKPEFRPDLGDTSDLTVNKPKPPLKKKDSEFGDLELIDALDNRNDGFNGGGGKPNIKPHQRPDLGDTSDLTITKPKPPLKKKDSEFGDLDLSDALNDRNDEFNGGGGKPNIKPHLRPDLGDASDVTITKPKPPLKNKDSEFGDLDLSDALDNRNDEFNGGGGQPNIKPHERLTDKDLEDVVAGGYQPDKGRGDGRYDNNDDPGTGTVAETGTIAGIASALAMALIGAVSSYISYQQKKFCFNIQQGVNTDYVKGQSLEGVSTEEPQVKYSALQTQSAEKPSQETPKI